MKPGPPPAENSDLPSGAPARDRPAETTARPPLAGRLRAYRLLIGLALGVLVADQMAKVWIGARVPFNPLHAHGGGNDIVVVRGFFYFIHVGNTGAAWSMLSGRSVLLAFLAAATLVAIFHWRRALSLKEQLPQICFGLLCGGIIGNLLDRLRHGHVIDFIDLHFGRYIYPTFNVADSAICVGVILYLLQSLRAPR